MGDFGSWSVLTTNFLVILFLALGGVTLSSILHLANAKWRFQIRYIACSLAALFPVAFVILLVLLANGEATFQWLAQARGGHSHLAGWHNYTFLVARQILGFGVVVALFALFIKLQYKTTVDDTPKTHRNFRNVALLIPFAYVLYGTMIAWDFEMTMLPGWHSASYGVYHFVSNFHGFLAFFALFLFFLDRSRRLTKPFQPEILNYFAQLMLAFTILWTYFYFTQYLVVWYGRLPEEIDRFDNMMLQNMSSLWWIFLSLKFIIPFVTFATYTPNRHNPTIISLVALGILSGTWLERYVWITGSVERDIYHIPFSDMTDLGTTLAVFIISWFAVRWALVRYDQYRPK